MRLIDADELKKDLTRFYDNEVTAKRLIDEQPTIEPESKWIPFQVRELTDEEREEHPDWGWIIDGDVPEDGQEILISRGDWVTTDTFIDEGECYLDGGWEIEKGMAWMPLPDPYKKEGEKE